MKTIQSDDFLKKRSAIYAEKVINAAKKALKEEDIRIASERELALIQEAAGIKLEGKHEFTVASGFVDSVYDRVIIEYKNPASRSAQIGENLNSPGTQKVVEQIKSRFLDLRDEHGQPLQSMFGVGLDGKYFVFVRFRDGKWSINDPVPVTPHSAERFLRALFNLGTQGKPFTPTQLAADFGADGVIAKAAIAALYDALAHTANPKALVFFNEWKIHFSEVCGYDVEKPSQKIKELAESYGLPIKGLKPANLLFSLHTYYALFMKLLAAELVSSVHQLPGGTPLRRMIQAVTSAKLRRELDDLEAGAVFRHFNITNFLEGDLFAWYLQTWSPAIEGWIRALITKLDEYNPGTLSEDPAESRDLLKKLYHRLFPKSVRHDLGEYYTPDWLAEHLLDKLGYEGVPDTRLLDPACGSGTFLVQAIARVRRWYEENREQCNYDEERLVQKILANIVGFDLNPLAVLAARTNFLIAIRDIIAHASGIEIPVYLCDAIMTPSEHGGLFAGTLERARELRTAAGKFIIPAEIANTQSNIARYSEILESCVRDGYTTEQFLLRCAEENLSVNDKELHHDLFKTLKRLDAEGRNGIWARIIKNAFAPLFTPQVDFIVGNPPWVNWENLPEVYRKSTHKLWFDYGLFRQKGYKAKLGGAKDDISILLTYVCHDAYLKPTGKLGFVITQSIFKTKGGGEGFRGLKYSNGGASETHISPIEVEDLSDLQVFEGATNRTAIFTTGKSSQPVKYPVPYVAWKKKNKGRIEQESSLDTVLANVTRWQQLAKPVEKNDLRSPWITGSKETLSALDIISGQADYVSRKGVYCPTNAIYWLSTTQRGAGGTLIVSNLADSGKKKVKKVVAAVEPKFVHKLIRGKDTARWYWKSELEIILPQDPEDASRALSEKILQIKFPKTFAYFKGFERDIRGCALLAQFFDPKHDPFYSSYNVGTYTYAPYKVVWKEICPEIEACVIEDGDGNIIPDHKLVFVSFDKPEPAYFLCGILNSTPLGLFVRSYAVQSSISGHVFQFVKIPRYSAKDPVHNKLVALARECHSADDIQVKKLNEAVDALAAEILNISEVDLKAIKNELSILRES